ncbi:autotransporter domain-containing protein [Roseobacter sp. HKCCD6575]|uniref:autotransporter outer membrane beta-barrel domain-containing protein n=1 Tax=unclassified Roseobacter TaxID=196798 RepID=UPI001492EFF2|nr:MULTISPECIES: autotransporter outer membrane beta-barrel domain-containing protein [unclassified Roseobacter]NNY28425.1 autotransporter domain-containing protein [Roseobacter sp. HKCCD9199]NNY49663.1 autotransporter domain-containing protein [Roseobacter sp. HKCCD8190]NOC36773.1 autotransporter domain-containing protein [Roseobacter sp. HKCCD7389]NPU71796.1 autotransporter domain-containing protein [Roseobacter sp. HKCCD6575]
MPNTAAYGQTFVVEAGATLNRAQFRINDGGTTISFDMHVYGWDSTTNRVTGLTLGSVAGVTAGVAGMETVTVDTTGIELVDAGDYVVFFQATSSGSASWGTAPSTTYADGDLVYQNNGGDTSRWDARSWVVASFIDTAFELLLATGPTTEEELANLMAATSGATLVFVNSARNVVRIQGQASLVARDQQMTATRAGGGSNADLVTVSTRNSQTGLVGNLYTWAEITGLRAEDDANDRDFTGRGFQIGGDVPISPNMVAGLSFGVQDLDVSGPSFSQEGVLRYLQPYLAYQSGPWSGEANIIYGLGEFTQTSTSGTGTGDTRLAALSLSGGYDFDMGDGLTLRPTLGLTHGTEEVTGDTGTLAGAGSTTVRFTEVSLGGRLTRNTAHGSFFAGLHADWQDTSGDTQIVSDLLAEDGWTGRLELGGSFESDNGLLFDTSVELGGLGGDFHSTSGALRLAIRF